MCNSKTDVMTLAIVHHVLIVAEEYQPEGNNIYSLGWWLAMNALVIGGNMF